MSLLSLLARLVLLFGLFGAAAHAAQPTHIRPSLVAETAAPAPGQTIAVAIDMQPEKGWHGYWKNPGDAGMDMQFDWTLPKGVTVGDPAYPVPERLLISGLMNHVYEGPFAILVKLTVDKDVAVGTRLPLRLEAGWLACTDSICVPERGELAMDLTVGDGTVQPSSRGRFDQWQAALPRPLLTPAHFSRQGGTVRIAVPLPASVGLVDPHFFAETPDAIDYAAAQEFRRSGDTLIVETVAAPTRKPAAVERIDGILALGSGQGIAISATPGTVPEGGVPAGVMAGDTAEPDNLHLIGTTFLAALLGGLLLNVMPCVFPILSLKALSLAKAGDRAPGARRDALAYTAGVILVCLALGAALLALREGGASVGWAFQLQDPRIILVLLLLVAAIALNLAGLFELPAITSGESLTRSGGMAGSFWTGALAAFVATPCTGPFMAAALGAALVMPWPAAMSIFLGLGLGLALPFLAIGFVPAIRRLLPKPGKWMKTFRHVLSVPMFLTAVGLGWILARQAGTEGLYAGLAALVVLSVALWGIGRLQRGGRPRAWLPVLPVLVAGGIAVSLLPSAAGLAGQPSADLAGDSFSEARLAELRAEGRPVFLYFTADWCLTCKVNEKVAIQADEVEQSFDARNVAVLVGDWTRGDAGITRFLEAHKRSGVPLYLYYAPGAPKPVILPQILTPSMLTALGA